MFSRISRPGGNRICRRTSASLTCAGAAARRSKPQPRLRRPPDRRWRCGDGEHELVGLFAVRVIPAGASQSNPFTSQNAIVTASAVRLLPSGNAWFFVSRTSGTAAFIGKLGWNSTPPQAAWGACSADSARSSLTALTTVSTGRSSTKCGGVEVWVLRPPHRRPQRRAALPGGDRAPGDDPRPGRPGPGPPALRRVAPASPTASRGLRQAPHGTCDVRGDATRCVRRTDQQGAGPHRRARPGPHGRHGDVPRGGASVTAVDSGRPPGPAAWPRCGQGQRHARADRPRRAGLVAAGDRPHLPARGTDDAIEHLASGRAGGKVSSPSDRAPAPAQVEAWRRLVHSVTARGSRTTTAVSRGRPAA
jgi:hypothetical protein